MEQEIDITLNDQEGCDCHHTECHCHCHKDEDNEDTPEKSTTPVVYEELTPDDFDDWD